MERIDLFGRKISRLGLGCMRLPTFPDGKIDEEEVQKMVDEAVNGGINYFDTAYPYHDGMSEIVMGRCLSKHDRAKFFLVDKFPGHQTQKTFDVPGIFEEQLKKCRTDYFDIYLLHNVCESSIDNYFSEDLGIVKYLLRQKELGRIRHLGFSTHARVDTLKKLLGVYGSIMEVCQIQLNYVDYTLQSGKEKMELLKEYGIPLVIMEPLRGGKLARIGDDGLKELKKLRPDASPVEWAFDFLKSFDDVKVVLSGMSTLFQLRENMRIFSNPKKLEKNEFDALVSAGESLKGGVPCTACGYCRKGCPMHLNIPLLLNLYNDLSFQATVIAGMQIDKLSENELPYACIRCGACRLICPQKIDIPRELENFGKIIPTLPSWAEICRRREEAAKIIREKELG